MTHTPHAALLTSTPPTHTRSHPSLWASPSPTHPFWASPWPLLPPCLSLPQVLENNYGQQNAAQVGEVKKLYKELKVGI